MLPFLRLIAWLEGVSFLLLLGVAMPMKYVFGQPEMVRIVGQAHGGLFVAYVFMLVVYARIRDWPIATLALGLLSASLPFAPFWYERRYLNSAANPSRAVK